MKVIPEDMKNNIKKYLGGGISHREIARKTNVSKNTVNRIASEVNSGQYSHKGGRPKLLSVRDQTYCARQLTTGRKKTAVDVQKSLKEDLNVVVHVNTIRNALKQRGLVSIVKSKKPLPSKKKQ